MKIKQIQSGKRLDGGKPNDRTGKIKLKPIAPLKPVGKKSTKKKG